MCPKVSSLPWNRLKSLKSDTRGRHRRAPLQNRTEHLKRDNAAPGAAAHIYPITTTESPQTPVACKRIGHKCARSWLRLPKGAAWKWKACIFTPLFLFKYWGQNKKLCGNQCSIRLLLGAEMVIRSWERDLHFCIEYQSSHFN